MKMKQSLIFAAFVVVCTFTEVSFAANNTSAAIYRDTPFTGKMIDAGFIYGETNYHVMQ
jgi:hypothetical protein